MLYVFRAFLCVSCGPRQVRSSLGVLHPARGQHAVPELCSLHLRRGGSSRAAVGGGQHPLPRRPAVASRHGRWLPPVCCTPGPSEKPRDPAGQVGAGCWGQLERAVAFSRATKISLPSRSCRSPAASQPGPACRCVRTGTCALLPLSEREPGLPVRLCAPRGALSSRCPLWWPGCLPVHAVPWGEHHSVLSLQS